MKKRDNLEFAFEKMKASETNEFFYRKWIGKFGFDNFKTDVGKCPGRDYVLYKVDESKPFSPSNFKWGKKAKINTGRRIIKQREVYDCFTLQLHIALGSDLSKSGVYKLTFDNGWFYIGSTKNFRRRVSCTAGTFRGVSNLHNKSLIRCVAECRKVTFEVLEYIAEGPELKIRETEIIKPFIGHDLLINRAYDAHSNKGIKWTEEEKRKSKETLIKKYLEGKTNSKYNWAKNYTVPKNLFNSKLFGDKEK